MAERYWPKHNSTPIHSGSWKNQISSGQTDDQANLHSLIYTCNFVEPYGINIYAELLPLVLIKEIKKTGTSNSAKEGWSVY